MSTIKPEGRGGTYAASTPLSRLPRHSSTLARRKNVRLDYLGSGPKDGRQRRWRGKGRKRRYEVHGITDNDVEEDDADPNEERKVVHHTKEVVVVRLVHNIHDLATVRKHDDRQP